MHQSLVSCKNEENQINKEGTRAFTTLFIVFFRCSRAVNSVVSGRIWLKFELIQALMHVLVKKIKLKMKALECSHHFFHCKSRDFFQTPKDSQLRCPRSDLAEL